MTKILFTGFYIGNMSIGDKLEKVLVNLGRNNKPTFVAMGVAAAKGIFRPIFTMSDKKQNPDSKKYTATRECLTELIAIPVYWGSGKLAETIAAKLAKPKDMSEELYKKIKGEESFAGTDMEALAKSTRKNLFKMKTTLSMFGVFLSALLIIPAVCSATIKPLMNVIQKSNKKGTANININNEVKEPVEKPVFKGHNMYKNSLYNCNNYGMRVGL